MELPTRENAGTSSEQARENRARRKPKVSYAMPISVGLVGPKPRAMAVGDGQPVNIPAPVVTRYQPRGDAGGKAERGVGDAASKPVGERWGIERSTAVEPRGDGVTQLDPPTRKTPVARVAAARTANRHR